jgi:hypothetical protein
MMFLLRAVSWFMVVAVAIPRETPNGFARGSADETQIWLDRFQTSARTHLASLKAQMKTQDLAAKHDLPG